jgi:hypothetical protein
MTPSPTKQQSGVTLIIEFTGEAAISFATGCCVWLLDVFDVVE